MLWVGTGQEPRMTPPRPNPICPIRPFECNEAARSWKVPSLDCTWLGAKEHPETSQVVIG